MMPILLRYSLLRSTSLFVTTPSAHRFWKRPKELFKLKLKSGLEIKMASSSDAVGVPADTINVVAVPPSVAVAPNQGISASNDTVATPLKGGFVPKRKMSHGSSVAAPVAFTERAKYISGIAAKLPELNLGEMTRVMSCFAAVLGEGRESITTSLELRVVLGDLGVYPAEEELEMVLKAFHYRISYATLCRYLQLYKKEYQLDVALSAGQGVTRSRSVQYAADTNYSAFSAAANRGDEDTLKAFVALGGGDDGSGSVAAATLRDAIRGFGLTIDIDAMIDSVDINHSGVLDYGDFCALWAQPTDDVQSHDTGTSINGAALSLSNDEKGKGSLPNIAETHKRLVSLITSMPRRPSAQVTSPGRAKGQNNPQRLPELSSMTYNSADEMLSSITPTRAAIVKRPGGRLLIKPPPDPITDEEHHMLVRMVLFPEEFEPPRRQTRHPQQNTQGGRAIFNGQGEASGGLPGISTMADNGMHKSMSTVSRSRRVTRSNMRNSTRGRKAGASRKGENDDLSADFFSPRNQNVYRPPSPMILSLRNSTAYRSRLKRLEEQKRMGSQTPRDRRGMYATTTPRSGRREVEDRNSRPQKNSTW